MSKPIVQNASDKKEVREGQHQVRRNEERDEDDLKMVMSTPEGRRWMWTFLSGCSAYESVFHPSGSQTAWNSGRQDIAHTLMKQIIRANSDLYLLMQQEAFKEAKNNG